MVRAVTVVYCVTVDVHVCGWLCMKYDEWFMSHGRSHGEWFMSHGRSHDE